MSIPKCNLICKRITTNFKYFLFLNKVTKRAMKTGTVAQNAIRACFYSIGVTVVMAKTGCIKNNIVKLEHQIPSAFRILASSSFL